MMEKFLTEPEEKYHLYGKNYGIHHENGAMDRLPSKDSIAFFGGKVNRQYSPAYGMVRGRKDPAPARAG